MLLVKFVGIILFSIALSLVVTACYIKLLSIVKRRYGETIRSLKLFQKICNPRGNSGEDSKWEVYSIQYFDNVYNFLNTNILRIVRVIRDIWCNKKNYYTNERYSKNPNRYLKDFFQRHTCALRLIFFSSFSILILFTMLLLTSLSLNPQIAIHIVDSFTPLFVVALSTMALSGFLLILSPEPEYAKNHYNQTSTKKDATPPSLPQPAIVSHFTRGNKCILILNKMLGLQKRDNRQDKTSNKTSQPYPLTHLLTFLKCIISRIRKAVQPNANKTGRRPR